jgi:hypothetical protein
MPGPRLLFLNYLWADTGTIGDDKLSADYVLACRFLRCSIMDRTRSLRQGFDYAVLDRIPTAFDRHATFGELCDQRATDLVRQAAWEDRDLCVLWSGGIDSTAALVAIARAAHEANAWGRVIVVLSQDSVHENPRSSCGTSSGSSGSGPQRTPSPSCSSSDCAAFGVPSG